MSNDNRKVDTYYNLSEYKIIPEKTGVSLKGMAISKIKKITDQLLKSETMYRDLVNCMNEGLVITDEKSNFIYMNPRFCEMLECTQEEIMGMHARDILDETNFNKFVKEVKIRRTKGKVSRYELTFIAKSGKKLHCLLSVFPVIENECYKGSNITVTDLTELKEKEETLKKSEMMYRDLVISMNEGLAITDEMGNCIFVNPKLCEMLEYSEEELTSMRNKDIMDGKSRLLLIDEPAKLAGGKSSKYEIVYITKSGKKLPVLLSVSPIIINGVYKGARSVITDISYFKEMEKKLLQAQKMEAIGVLAGGIAHDFNNILQTVLGYTQVLLQNKPSHDPDFINLKAIEESAQKASSLTKQLLVFARKSESNLKPTDLNREVNKISEILSRTLPKMIKIELNLEEKLKTVNADSVQIEQIIMNIGLNAAYAMSDGGRLIIETGNVTSYDKISNPELGLNREGYVLLRISDTGSGMDGETQKHIFEPFFTTKGADCGTGLGLAMVYGLVESHKGHIICCSKPDHGTMFTIYLPVIEAMPAENYAKKIEGNKLHCGNETILLVDDEEPLRRLGYELLNKQGFTVFVAENGEEALEIYRENKKIIDLVILDVSMPGMGGYLCFKELKKMNPNIKVIIVTGYSDNGKVKEIIKSGAAGFVGKPYRFTKILNKIQEILDTKTNRK